MTEMTVGVPRRWAGWTRARHLAGMVVAMVAGMVVLGPLWRIGGELLGGAGVLARPDVGALLMATNMAVGMVAWMWYRGDGWPAAGETSAAVYVPFLLLLPAWWAGWVGDDVLLLGGHLLMLPAMALVALRHPATAPPRRHPVVAAVARRWPVGLALLMTVDMWFAPGVVSPWSLLVLPAGYLVIGAWRRQLGDHRVDRVVPRGYAEWCVALDVVVGVTTLLAVAAG